LLASLAARENVRAGGEAHVADAQADEFGYSEPGLDRNQKERVVATAEPGAAVRRAEQRLDLLEVEVADVVSLVAFGRDRHHPADRLKVLGVSERGVPVERVDRRQPVVASPRAAAAVDLEVVEECADQRRVEIVDVQLAGRFPGLFGSEREQQPECVAVRANRVRACVELGDQALAEKRL
jgi:hypothetical protein